MDDEEDDLDLEDKESERLDRDEYDDEDDIDRCLSFFFADAPLLSSELPFVLRSESRLAKIASAVPPFLSSSGTFTLSVFSRIFLSILGSLNI